MDLVDDKGWALVDCMYDESSDRGLGEDAAIRSPHE